MDNGVTLGENIQVLKLAAGYVELNLGFLLLVAQLADKGGRLHLDTRRAACRLNHVKDIYISVTT